ncbi:MAG TPA: glutathione peroxidase [Stellaceae bacterium]|nr:glutathione peroxidase [Stellaceae bacterium]
MVDRLRRRAALLASLCDIVGTAPAQRARGGGMSGYDFTFTSIDGRPLPLAQYRGRPLLVVNTASFCGFTYQYEDLEALWRRYRDRGLVVLGVPSNDFGQQEPGSAQEIKQFCESRYAVDFPLTEKQEVIGPRAHPFFQWIAAELGDAGVPRWNFHKYLLGLHGELKGAWPSSVRPADAVVTAEIEKLLIERTLDITSLGR